MGKLGLLLALGALGLAGWVAYGQCERDQQILQLTEGNQDLQDAMGDLETKLDAALRGERADPTMLAATGGMNPLSGEDGAPSLATQGAPRRSAATTSERIAALEEAVAEAKRESKATGMSPGRMFSRDKLYFNLDSAAKSLELDERQKGDLQDAIDRGKSELADLYKIENDEGLTWAEVRKPKMAKVGADNGFSIAMPDFAKIQKFKKSRIPGSSETFGQAEQRIKDGAFANMRRTLTPKQATKWDKAHKDPLLNSSGGMATVSFSSIQIGGEEEDK